jgi:predicted MPP superfamily phosphohydrolase
MVVVLVRIHFFPGFCLLALGLALELFVLRAVLRRFPQTTRIWTGAALASGLLLLGYLLEFGRVARYFPVSWSTWLECASILELMALLVAALRFALPSNRPEFETRRRVFLQTAAAGLCVAPAVVTGFGVLRRNQFRLSEVRIPVTGLPSDLDGLRIVQITDIHLSPFLSEREFARAIDMANETRANLALVTGDLISRRGDPLDACLRQLARLRAEAGVLGCLGNHEIYTGTSDYVASEGARIGIDFLRSRTRLLRFGGAALNFAGVDYQRFERPYLRGAESLVVPGALNILLSHNPDVFPVAASQGYDLTISGHTHGGQVDFEILHQHMNVARVYTPYVAGLYTRGKASVYVSNGLGTIGVPVRIGAPAEVSLLRLCAT